MQARVVENHSVSFFSKMHTRYVHDDMTCLTSFDGDLLGLFEGDWLGVDVG